MILSTLAMLTILGPVPDIAAKLPPSALRVPAGQPSYRATLNKNGRLLIRLGRPTDHLMGAKVRMGQGVSKVIFDRGVYSMWRVDGTADRDVLQFGSQGTIINRRVGGVFDMGKDRVSDRFIFTNTINVAACSAKHPELKGGCHPLNHLQQVTIKNFGPEDRAILQGRTYTYRDIRGNSFPGVPETRLRVVPLP